ASWLACALLFSLLALVLSLLFELFRRSRLQPLSRQPPPPKPVLSSSPPRPTYADLPVATPAVLLETAEISSGTVEEDTDSSVMCTGGEGEGWSEDTRTDSSERSLNAGFDPVCQEQIAGQLAAAHPALREKVGRVAGREGGGEDEEEWQRGSCI
ncbi:MAG: hypothetical protein SGPRY_014315, partial [Prymnesium sp.]